MNILERPNRKGDKITFYYDYGRGRGQRSSTGIFIYTRPKKQTEKNHNKQAVDDATVAALFGHTTTTQVRKVYKRHRPKDQTETISKLPPPNISQYFLHLPEGVKEE
jgi:hypothetical protein